MIRPRSRVSVEWNGKWLNALVLQTQSELDGQRVQVQYDAKDGGETLWHTAGPSKRSIVLLEDDDSCWEN